MDEDADIEFDDREPGSFEADEPPELDPSDFDRPADEYEDWWED